MLTAAVVTPGLIDAHSVVPLERGYNIPADQDADETSDPNQADLRVLDAFNPNEPLLRFLREQGVTVVHACPGRANVIAGQTGVFRTHGTTAEGDDRPLSADGALQSGRGPQGDVSRPNAPARGWAPPPSSAPPLSRRGQLRPQSAAPPRTKPRSPTAT